MISNQLICNRKVRKITLLEPEQDFVSFEPSRRLPGHSKVSFDLVNYTKSYLRKTIWPYYPEVLK